MASVGKFGFVDEAAEQDRFGIQDYIGGLATFIRNCNTPLTLSIQGSWGTGKTSIMNLIKNELHKYSDVKTIWFNTWQFSQFNMDDQLAISLLSNLIAEFEITDGKALEDTNKIIKGLRIATSIGKNLMYAYVDNKLGGSAKEVVQKGVEAVTESFDSPEVADPTLAIRKLREQFAHCVQKTCDGQTKDKIKRSRIVVFIDDLDRLEPRKAVELLEVLKIFLDCNNCVFVLAIDFDVVCRGVAVKYGTDSGNEDDIQKGRSFFDKIIQVPFKMPVASYDISGYVKYCFQAIRFRVDENALKSYIDLIKYSIGTNPRSMKRLFNSYQLLTIVAKDLLNSEKNKQLLFAVLCLQYCSEKLYNFIVRNSDVLTGDLIGCMRTADYSMFEEMINQSDDIDDYEQITEDDLTSAKPFMEKFYEVIDTDGMNGIDLSEMENFKKVLNITAITNTSDTESEIVRRKEITLEEYFNPLKLTEALSWMVGKIEELKARGITVTAYFRKNSNNYLRFSDGNKRICDVYDTSAGWCVECFAKRSAARDALISEIRNSYNNQINDTSYTSSFVVYRVAEPYLFDMLVTRVMSLNES
jgi:hypothetical protein